MGLFSCKFPKHDFDFPAFYINIFMPALLPNIRIFLW